MRGVRVRFRDGSTDEWEVKEAMSLARLSDYFRRGFVEGKRIAFAAVSDDDRPSDLSIVGINLTDVVSWQVLGLSNLEHEAALWSELEGMLDTEDDEC
jgi:hypothetical protein